MSSIITSAVMVLTAEQKKALNLRPKVNKPRAEASMAVKDFFSRLLNKIEVGAIVHVPRLAHVFSQKFNEEYERSKTIVTSAFGKKAFRAVYQEMVTDAKVGRIFEKIATPLLTENQVDLSFVDDVMDMLGYEKEETNSQRTEDARKEQDAPIIIDTPLYVNGHDTQVSA